ncbi:ISAs1 family transposase [Pseudofrankia sp. DC12]|uniref:ISAs1 family transposase n=1 Tax=Pseudofrankia sp. DC12 TaxID=683315 RepID=UPI0005F7689C|nr:ISAs1 family transposase [Pseudofrankia sp. DC12]
MSSCQTGAALSSGLDNAGKEKIGRLLAMLRLVKDFRDARGRVYDLEFVLATATVATLAGATCYREIGSEAADLSQGLLAALGAPYGLFRGCYTVPCESTIRETLKGVNSHVLDLVVGTWLHEQATRDHNGDLVIALDGKVLRGAWSTENQQFTLFSAMTHNQGVVIAQTKVPADTNEITQVANLLKNIKHERGRTVITADAAHTQVKTAILLWKKRIDYVFTVKGNQPKLFQQIFDRLLPVIQKTPGHEVEECSRGSIKRWTTWTRPVDDIRFPRARTIAVICREEFDLTGARLSKEYAFIVTSLRGERAAPDAIHTHVRMHWGIENRVHYVRDTTWREDACQAHQENGPHNLAILRNLALGLLRLHGVTKIKETVQEIGRDRNRAVQYLAT